MPAHRTQALANLYRKAEDIGHAVVALIPSTPNLPPIDPYEVSRSMHPGARFAVEALVVGLLDVYDNPEDQERIRQVQLDLDTALAIFKQED